jgi:hypothetical protein
VTEQESVKFADEVEEIFCKIANLCRGHDTACVYAALSAMLGFSEAQAGSPDIDDLMRLVDKTARAHFEVERNIMRRDMN